MKRAMYNGLAAAGTAFALTLTGCTGGDTLSHVPLDQETASRIDAIGKACAYEMLTSQTGTSVRVIGNMAILEDGGRTFQYKASQPVADTPSALQAIASGEAPVISWENKIMGSTATVNRDGATGLPTELIVNPAEGTNASEILASACISK